MMKERNYDEKCLELAKHFLQRNPLNSKAARKSLAIQIQDAVEDWFLWASSHSPEHNDGWKRTRAQSS